MKKSLQLYLHIPFCVKKCDYCDFLSFPLEEKVEKRLQIDDLEDSFLVSSVNEEVKKQYVKALNNEIRSVKGRFKDYRVSTIFMGGGTPSILSCEEIREIFSALKENFQIDKDAEITIEANPGTVTEDKIVAWKEVGINRVSIGLQSAKDEELKLLGRIHTFQQFEETFLLLRENGFSNINVDLISGVPGQTMESYMETLNKVVESSPEHISAYGLIVDEGTKFGEIYGGCDERDRGDGKGPSKSTLMKAGGVQIKELYPSLPDEETERRMYKATKKQLEQQGYQRYEISNYAKEGFECKHNLGYWERVDYLGLGLGAASLIGNKRFHQESDIEQYVKDYSSDNVSLLEEQMIPDEREQIKEMALGKREQIKNQVILDEKDQMEEFMFLGLRKTMGISKTKFNEEFSRNIDEVYGNVLLKLEKESLVETTGDQICLTEKGVDVSNVVLAEFLF